MALKSTNPTSTDSWKKLQSHFENLKPHHLKSLFDSNPNRANDLTIQWDDFYVDYSKNRITQSTIDLFLELAEEMELKKAIKLAETLINE